MLRGVARDGRVERGRAITVVMDARCGVAAVLYGGSEGVCPKLDGVGVERGGARHRAAAIHLLIRRLYIQVL